MSLRRAPRIASSMRLPELGGPILGARFASRISSHGIGHSQFSGAGSTRSSQDAHSSAAMRPAAWTDGSSRGRIQKYSVTDVVSWLDAELAVSVTVMDARGLMDGAVGEFIIFATARSTSHMKRVSGTVMHELSARGVLMFGSAPTIEGLNSDDGWMVIDGGQVLVNVMTIEAQRKFELEHRWETNGATVVLQRPARE